MRQIAVLGLGKFGRTIAKELTDRGAQVIAIDNDKDIIEELKEHVTYAIGIDTTDEGALRAAGVQNVDIAIVCIGNKIEANLLTTSLLKKLGVKKIWARAISPQQQEIIKTMEVDNIINLEEEMGKIVASSLLSENIAKHIPIAEGHSIAEIKLPKSFIGKSIRKIDPRKNFNVNIVAIKKLKPEINDQGERDVREVLFDVPSPDMEFDETDTMLLVGSNSDIERFSKQ
ncbi:MAG: TrkA family potassium uptake protein [Candidatus Margulisiibacteriota bacterium]